MNSNWFENAFENQVHIKEKSSSFFISLALHFGPSSPAALPGLLLFLFHLARYSFPSPWAELAAAQHRPAQRRRRLHLVSLRLGPHRQDAVVPSLGVVFEPNTIDATASIDPASPDLPGICTRPASLYSKPQPCLPFSQATATPELAAVAETLNRRRRT